MSFNISFFNFVKNDKHDDVYTVVSLIYNKFSGL